MRQLRHSMQIWVWLGFLGFALAEDYKGSKSPGDTPFQRCQVSDHERVLCGDPSISSADCEAISCCFDQGQCYYGKAVTVQCLRDGQFLVVVARDATIPTLSLDSVSLLEGGTAPPCGPVSTTDAFAIFLLPVSACGTTVKEEGGYVVYENKMWSSYEVLAGPAGSITRDSVYELSFQCRYLGSEWVSLLAEVNTLAPPAPVAAVGPLRVELRLAKDQCHTKGCNEVSAYDSYYGEMDYPVTKVLQQPVYVEVHILDRTDPNIVLLLENCWATSTSSPLSLPQWNLLVDGCPYQDEKYLTTLLPVDDSSGLQNPTHYKRFVFKMFTFVDASLIHLKETVFVHCSTAVCHPSAIDTCEQRCNRQKRAAPVAQESRETALVSSGEVIMTVQEVPLSSMRLSVREEPQSLSYGLLGVAASTVLVISALVLAVVWRPRPQIEMLEKL